MNKNKVLGCPFMESKDDRGRAGSEHLGHLAALHCGKGGGVLSYGNGGWMMVGCSPCVKLKVR